MNIISIQLHTKGLHFVDNNKSFAWILFQKHA